MIFGVLPDVVRDVRAKRNDAKARGAGEIESGARELAGESPAFQGRRDFRVKEGDVVAEPAVGDQRVEALDARFEALGFLVMDHCDVVEI